MKVAILGFDIEGRASYDYYSKHGADITICDQKTELVDLPQGVPTRLGDSYLDGLDEFDVLVRTAGLPPAQVLEKNSDVINKVTTLIDEFLRVCPTQNVIGVTGTKGKGTTSTLITQILEASGRKVFLGGNIGVPPLAFLDEITADDWVVLELSSFQLSDLKHSPHIGVCLMIVPEHLNWHRNYADYKEAKSHLFANQNSDDIAIYFADNDDSREVADAGAGHKFPFYKSPGSWVNGNMITMNGAAICTTDELKLLGKHNWQNVCAAVTAAWFAGVRNPEPIRQVLTSFSGLPYHLELIREIDGARYYNDSFGTTPETAQVAIEAFTEPKILILGGSDKGVPFDGLAKTVKASNVRQVILIGNPDSAEHPASAPKIEAALRAVGYDSITSLVKPGGVTMNEIVDAARSAARADDVVLFSTAGASFDMFNNYKERGKMFTDAVSAL